jgi:hypothetical protein
VSLLHPVRLAEFSVNFFYSVRKSKCTTRINNTGGKFATGINDIRGKFATGINDTSGKFYHQFCWVLLIPVANLPRVSTYRRQICYPRQRSRGQIPTGINDTGGKQWEEYQTADNLK